MGNASKHQEDQSRDAKCTAYTASTPRAVPTTSLAAMYAPCPTRSLHLPSGTGDLRDQIFLREPTAARARRSMNRRQQAQQELRASSKEQARGGIAARPARTHEVGPELQASHEITRPLESRACFRPGTSPPWLPRPVPSQVTVASAQRGTEHPPTSTTTLGVVTRIGLVPAA